MVLHLLKTESVNILPTYLLFVGGLEASLEFVSVDLQFLTKHLDLRILHNLETWIGQILRP